MHVVALFLGDMSVWAVYRFHVLPERAGVRVAFGAAWDLADIGFLGREAGLCYELLSGSAPHSPKAMPRPLAGTVRRCRTCLQPGHPGWSHAGPRPAGAQSHWSYLPSFHVVKHMAEEALNTSWGHRSEAMEGVGTQSLV